jgi:D-glycero-D-manno-heptose 1,7-bisphosphate phosphatase
MEQIRKRYVALDRDGVIIIEKEYLSDPGGVEIEAGAIEGMRRMHELGLGLVVVTNQSGVGRGYYDLAAVDRVHRRMLDLLGPAGGWIEGIYVCPHSPEQSCDCRKPKTGLLQRAASELGFDPAESFVIGDKASDVEMGRNAGAVSILVRTGYGREHEARGTARPDYAADDLAAAAAIIARALGDALR